MKTTPKILIVEDDNFVLINVKDFLLEEGFDVVCVCTGIDAVVACEKDISIDLVLMDGELPLMNGFDAAKAIKQHRNSLPIISISGNDIPDHYKNLFVAHHKKPFDFLHLASIIRKILSTSYH